MRKHIIWTLLIMSLINFASVKTTDMSGFSAVFQGLAGVDWATGQVSTFLLVLNLGIQALFVFFIMTKVDELLSLGPYLVVRSSRKAFLKKIQLELLGVVSRLTSLMLVVNLVFSFPLNPGEIKALIFVFVAYLINFLFWGNVVVGLLLLYVSKSWVYFSVIITLLFLQIGSAHSLYASLFVAGSIDVLENTLLVLVGKFIILFVSYVLLSRLVNHYEFKGDNKR
ncbi:hypothetical protein HXA35_19740 [Bacillus sp. A301a_S52]|nr:hypothetical protein [Bacillus sp. A301a_S52]